jgi:glucokinase
VRFALARVEGGRVELDGVWKRPGKDFPTFAEALAAFRQEHPDRLDGASLGLAGAVLAGKVELLHRGWTVDVRDVRRALGVSRVVMVNDFVAMARSAPELADTQEIAPGAPDPAGAIAVGGPGTGFGMAVLRRLQGAEGWVVVGGEGGHQAFGPQGDLESQVAKNLRGVHGYVSNEMVVAGSGFADAFGALADAMGLPREKLTEAEVAARALNADPLCAEFCRLRARTVMTVMGNLALLSNATGGVFLAGGVTTRIVSWLKESAALNRFYRRGARTGLMSNIPIRLITSQEAPLVGAAHLWLDEEVRGWL